MAQRLLNNHKATNIIHIKWSHEDNPIHSFSLSPQWLCGNMTWLYLYYTPWFVIFEHSVYNEGTYIHIHIYIYIHIYIIIMYIYHIFNIYIYIYIYKIIYIIYKKNWNLSLSLVWEILAHFESKIYNVFLDCIKFPCAKLF